MYATVSTERYYQRVKNHLERQGVWSQTVKKHPPSKIKSIISSILERYREYNLDPETLDWASAFENLRDYESKSAFLNYLERMGYIPYKRSELTGYYVSDAEIEALYRAYLEDIGEVKKVEPPKKPAKRKPVKKKKAKTKKTTRKTGARKTKKKGKTTNKLKKIVSNIMGRRKMPRKKKTGKKAKRTWQRKPRGQAIAVSYRQKGRAKSPKRDRRFKALPPGKRESVSGEIYYEYRANRSDVDPKTMKNLPRVGSKKKSGKKKRKSRKKKR